MKKNTKKNMKKTSLGAIIAVAITLFTPAVVGVGVDLEPPVDAATQDPAVDYFPQDFYWIAAINVETCPEPIELPNGEWLIHVEGLEAGIWGGSYSGNYQYDHFIFKYDLSQGAFGCFEEWQYFELIASGSGMGITTGL